MSSLVGTPRCGVREWGRSSYGRNPLPQKAQRAILTRRLEQ